MSLAPRPSRWLAGWWCGVHAVAVLGIAASAVPPWLASIGVTAVLVFAWLRWPKPPPQRLELAANGLWSLPLEGRHGLELAPGATVGPFWVELSLRPRRVTAVDEKTKVLLIRDQLEAQTWRALQAELRRTRRQA